MIALKTSLPVLGLLAFASPLNAFPLSASAKSGLSAMDSAAGAIQVQYHHHQRRHHRYYPSRRHFAYRAPYYYAQPYYARPYYAPPGFYGFGGFGGHHHHHHH